MRAAAVPGVLIRPGARDPVVTVRAGDDAEVHLVIDRGRSPLRGRVQAANGAPLAGVVVAAMREQDGDDPRRLLGWGSGELPAVTDAAGRFSLGERFPGSYDLVAYRPGGGTTTARALTLAGEVHMTLPTDPAAGR